MKQEAALKGRFTKALANRAPQFQSLAQLTAGAPDRCILGLGRATFWEFKHGTPKFESPGLQELTCIRVNAHCHCRYVLWLEDRHGENKQTLIVHPQVVHDKLWLSNWEHRCDGYDMKWLAELVWRSHARP